MKILYIAPIFSPANRIAAVRSSKMAKYLQRAGHEVTVIMSETENTEVSDELLEKDVEELSEVIRLSNSQRYQSIYNRIYGVYSARKADDGKRPAAAETRSSRPAAKRNGLKDFVRTWLNIYKSYDFASCAIRYLKAHNVAVDAVVSTYGPFSSHMIARYYKKKHPTACWTAEYRDLVEYASEHTLAGLWARRYWADVNRKADVLVAVSKGVANKMPACDHSKVHVITNGFDPEDCTAVEQVDNRQDPRWMLSYCGALYYNRRDLSLLFRALRELADEGRIDLRQVVCVYAGKDFSQLVSQAAPYGMEQILENRGFIKREAAISIQHASDILLLATWNTTEEQGILSGKFLEYMMHQHPIVCIVSGDVPNSEVKEIISEYHLGACCEEIGGESEFLKLKEYLYSLYQKHSRGENSMEESAGGAKNFSYSHLAQSLEDLLRSNICRAGNA